ncbi:hypothetical protein [Microvirga sp. VF16]|nr:hypothetical protein [Microvirga sp. VF16]QRM35172.1 hypothetical protein JO965_40015 [Microvirga sp. VF16]
MTRATQHLLNHLERPRRRGMSYHIAARVGLLNLAATVTTLLVADPLF